VRCFLPILLSACAASPSAPATPRDLESADAVAVYALPQGPAPVLITGGVASWAGQTRDLGGSVGVVTSADIDGDGLDDAIIATGRGRDRPEAPIAVWSIGSGGAELLWQTRTPRNQVTELRLRDGRLFIAWFSSSKDVSAGWLEDGQVTEIAAAHMGMRQLPLADGRLVQGRLYGEQPRSDGDLRLRSTDGTIAPLVSLRGVRALAAADLDGDGDEEVLVGDGWHSHYGKHGDARVRMLDGAELTDGRTIGFLDGEYAARELAVVGSGSAAGILVTGTTAVHWMTRDALGWAMTRVTPVTEVGNAVPYPDPSGLMVLVAGEPARLVPLETP